MARIQLAPHFYLDEFDCNDGTPVPEEYHDNVVRLARDLEIFRAEVDEPVTIISAYRHDAYNKKVGGKPRSQHKKANAVDITVKSKSPRQVKAILERLIKRGAIPDGGIGLYPGFVHYDHGRPRRW
jgi:uncharacterized protein YcbK (DUF882 family)